MDALRNLISINIRQEEIMNGFYTMIELKDMGFQGVGEDLYISRKTSFYNPSGICIGSHVRIDDYCVLVGNIRIGDYIHIGSHSSLHASGEGRITMEDYSGIYSNVTIYASSDNFDGEWMTCRPDLPKECTNVVFDHIVLGGFSQVGTGSTILPKGRLGEGTAVGAMSLVNKPLEPWYVYAGIPCKAIRPRSKKMLEMVQ